MKQVKTLVFTTERDLDWLIEDEKEIVATLDDVKNVEIETFQYVTVDDLTPVTYVNSEGNTKISQAWFDDNFTSKARDGGFNAVCFHFNRKERRKWKLAATINGSYYRDTDKVWEFWVCADKNQRSTNQQKDRSIKQYPRVFIHEFGHGFIHAWHPNRRDDVHEYDYEKDDIKALFKTLEAPADKKGLDGLTIDKRYDMQNFWAGNDPRSIVLHTTGGKGVAGAVQTLLARGLSYNYLIDEVGNIYQLVHYNNSAWHAGVIKNPTVRAQVFYKTLRNKDNPNRNSVGIAYTYPNGDISVLSDSAVDSTIKLMKAIGFETGVRYTAENIFAHREVTSDKPAIVLGYREQVVEAIVGDKDEKDVKEKARLQLLLQYLQLKVQLLLLQLKIK
jgi:hypothetical protein